MIRWATILWCTCFAPRASARFESTWRCIARAFALKIQKCHLALAFQAHSRRRQRRRLNWRLQYRWFRHCRAPTRTQERGRARGNVRTAHRRVPWRPGVRRRRRRRRRAFSHRRHLRLESRRTLKRGYRFDCTRHHRSSQALSIHLSASQKLFNLSKRRRRICTQRRRLHRHRRRRRRSRALCTNIHSLYTHTRSTTAVLITHRESTNRAIRLQPAPSRRRSRLCRLPRRSRVLLLRLGRGKEKASHQRARHLTRAPQRCPHVARQRALCRRCTGRRSSSVFIRHVARRGRHVVVVVVVVRRVTTRETRVARRRAAPVCVHACVEK